MPLALAAIALLWTRPAVALDLERYGALLAGYTRVVGDTAGTRVNYARLRQTAEWRELVDGLDSDQPKRLGRNEALAYWINAYNILAIDTVVRNYPLGSIRDVGSFFRPVWDLQAGSIGGRSYTLGEIEHEILRPMKDPRVHAAIVCASTSCPSLRREPFTGQQIDSQLDEEVRRFLASTDKGLRIEPKHSRVILSRIFEWFEDDFASSGGVIEFAARYAPESTAAWLLKNGENATVTHFDYDWALNDEKGSSG